MGPCHGVYIESEDLIAQLGVTYSKRVGIPKAILACFVYALLPLHRERRWCLDLSEYGVSSTRLEAKKRLDKG